MLIILEGGGLAVTYFSLYIIVINFILIIVEGGGLAADTPECLPLHCNDFQTLKPHVIFLAHLYDVESVRSRSVVAV